jgi:hypothetical protein
VQIGLTLPNILFILRSVDETDYCEGENEMSMNQYDLAAIVAINDLEGDNYHKLSAKQQKEIFGANILGRKSVCFDPTDQGTVYVSWRADGTDNNLRKFTYERFAQMVAAGEKITDDTMSNVF